MNAYLAITNGGYLCSHILCAWIAAWHPVEFEMGVYQGVKCRDLSAILLVSRYNAEYELNFTAKKPK